MEKQWKDLSADEKQEAMFDSWLSPKGVKFVNPEAEQLYKERVTRFKDAIQLRKKPDRVPVFPNTNFFPALYSGITPQEAMYDYDKLYAAYKKYVLDFAPDAHGGAGLPGPGRMFEILDYKLYNWPGHGVDPRYTYQAVEREYVNPDEYDKLIADPAAFFTNTYLPRIMGALDGFKLLPPLTGIIELPFTGPNIAHYGLPEVQASLEKLMEAGREALKWFNRMHEFDREMASLGFPCFFGGFTKTPYDIIADTLRGTKGAIMDVYRQPAKLLEALEALTPIAINMGTSVSKLSGNPIVFIPLHKGADGFMSDAQFKKFYWPTFRKLLMGLIEEGCVPFSYVEGSFNTRLEVIKDVPKGKVIWCFDLTDMAKAAEILGDTECIAGNMPVVALNVATPQEVKDLAKGLIDTVGKNGGYIMSTGVALDEAKPDNVKAMVDFTKEYGIYK
ncbi:MAG: uroporphyrinogen decarboxylase family protein [Syntrophales bacterium]